MKSLNSLLVNILKPMDERITIQRKERSRKDTSMYRRSSKELDAANATVEKLTTMVEKLIAREKTEEERGVVKAEDIEGYRGEEDIDSILSFIDGEVSHQNIELERCIMNAAFF